MRPEGCWVLPCKRASLNWHQDWATSTCLTFLYIVLLKQLSAVFEKVLLLQITVTRLYPEGMDPPPKRRQVVQQHLRQESPQVADADINTKMVGAAEPVDNIQPETRQDMYAGLGLESSDEES